MFSYLKLIRIPNLIIIAILQLIIYYGILQPALVVHNITPDLDGAYIFLFVITTILITTSGYIINDMIDIKTDKINKPNKQIINKKITLNRAKVLYLVVLIAGFVIAMIIAIHIKKTFYIFFYVMAIYLLFVYSKYLKGKLLIGNIFVSLFSAMVLGILLVFEKSALSQLKEVDINLYYYIINIFAGFMLFSFLVSVYRELVKDMEDMEGDIAIGAKTFPLVYGIEISKMLAGIISIAILISLFYWMKMDMNYGRSYLKIYIILFVVLPLFYSVYLLKTSRNKYDFYRISNLIKVIMVAGILILLFYIL